VSGKQQKKGKQKGQPFQEIAGLIIYFPALTAEVVLATSTAVQVHM
jgi:hypothetical protein